VTKKRKEITERTQAKKVDNYMSGRTRSMTKKEVRFMDMMQGTGGMGDAKIEGIYRSVQGILTPTSFGSKQQEKQKKRPETARPTTVKTYLDFEKRHEPKSWETKVKIQNNTDKCMDHIKAIMDQLEVKMDNAEKIIWDSLHPKTMRDEAPPPPDK
jgi:hypothetical protein